MPNPRVGSAPRRPAPRPTRRRASRTVRRRRTLAVLTLAVVAMLALALRPGPSRNRTVSVNRNTPTTRRSSIGAPGAEHLDAARAGWQLVSPLSRAVAFADGACG